MNDCKAEDLREKSAIGHTLSSITTVLLLLKNVWTTMPFVRVRILATWIFEFTSSLRKTMRIICECTANPLFWSFVDTSNELHWISPCLMWPIHSRIWCTDALFHFFWVFFARLIRWDAFFDLFRCWWLVYRDQSRLLVRWLPLRWWN